jgi:uncharacterized protein with HEPN domain
MKKDWRAYALHIEQLKTSHSEIPWIHIAGFRNILVHDYLGDIDALTIQTVIEQHLPP